MLASEVLVYTLQSAIASKASPAREIRRLLSESPSGTYPAYYVVMVCKVRLTLLAPKNL